MLGTGYFVKIAKIIIIPSKKKQSVLSAKIIRQFPQNTEIAKLQK